MRRLVILFAVILIILSGCSALKQPVESSFETTYEFGMLSSEDNIIKNENPMDIGDIDKNRDPLPLVKSENKTAEKFFNEYLDKYESLCEITTYEYDLFNNYPDYYEKYSYAPGFEKSAEKKAGEELYNEKHYLLAYAGWPLEEIYKYIGIRYSDDTFDMARIYELPVTDDDTMFSLHVYGDTKNNILKKSLSYTNLKENIASDMECTLKDGKTLWRVNLKYKDGSVIFKEKENDGKWVLKNQKN